ncbi:MAG: UDP-glucose 4-epimerase GalE [Clostridiales bacterium]|nr:UDP-glucose 4-epimerase GalE [Clostridiales bacterium]
MRVLLTGGAGYIGSHTALCLLEAGYDVVALDNLSNSCPEALRRVEELTGKKAPLIVGDCTDEATLENVFSQYKIDAVIHFAGLKAVGESVAKPLEYYQNNLDATMMLCRVMKKHGCEALVFSSSATVYGTYPEMPLREDCPTGCTNPYGWTKWISERILTDIAHADPTRSFVLLRYFNPIGAHESGRIGEDPSGIPNNLMPYVCQVASGKLKQLSVFGDDYPTKDGTGERDYIHVMDLAEGHLAAIRYAASHKGVEVFNLGTGEAYSVLNLVHAFEKANGLTIPYRITERRPGDIPVCYADPKKAAEKLGWTAKRDLTTMCRDAWNWQKNNPLGYNVK